MFKHLLIPTDGSELSELAVAKGLELANALSARVTVATVTEPHPVIGGFEVGLAFPVDEYEKGTSAQAARILARAVEIGRSVGIECEFVHITGRLPAEGILAAASDNGCDLIVMSTHSRQGLSRILLGSQANKVVTHSPIPVLVCPPPGR